MDAGHGLLPRRLQLRKEGGRRGRKGGGRREKEGGARAQGAFPGRATLLKWTAMRIGASALPAGHSQFRAAASVP